MAFYHFNTFHPLSTYAGSHDAFGNAGSLYSEHAMNGDLQQPMWPGSVPNTPPNSPALYFSNADPVALPFMHYNYNAPTLPQYAIAANFQADEKVLNASQYSFNNDYFGAEVQNLDGLQYPTFPVYSPAGLTENYAVEPQLNVALFGVQSDYFPTTGNSPSGFGQAMFHRNYTHGSTADTKPLDFSQPSIHSATTDYPEAVQAMNEPYNNNTQWVNLDSTMIETGVKIPSHNAPKAPEKKVPAKSSKGIKKPRHKVSFNDRELLFRSCVTKLYDRCLWKGCNQIVFTDRKSITEHMLHVHGVDINLDFLLRCRWKGCKRSLKTKSVFRHITNKHMHVVEAHCLYGCGEVFSRVDGRSRHMLRCYMRPREA